MENDLPLSSPSACATPLRKSPIGLFDSGYGGLTVLQPIRKLLEQYDYLYLGDNARAPYGACSFEAVLEYTLEAVRYLFAQGCPLVILACNTASAKALRTIQQTVLPFMDDPSRRVLGVIRPTAEIVGDLSKSGHVGILGTEGTVRSGSYEIEIGHFFPSVRVVSLACPEWVPLVENGVFDTERARFIVEERLHKLLTLDPDIDRIILACTHYPLLLPLIHRFLPRGVELVVQGDYVAQSLTSYLLRHPEMEARLSRSASCRYLTTEAPARFQEHASKFLGEPVAAELVSLTAP